MERILNFRDVGAYINSLAGRSILREGVLFRSARPDDATVEDRQLLSVRYGIKTIVDLRSKTEHINQAKKRAATLPSSELIAQSNNAAAEPLKLPGIKYSEVNLQGGAFEFALVWQLSWTNMAKLGGLMALGYRNEGISVLGKNVMQPRGLTGLGIDTLDASWREIRQVLEVFSDTANYPVLVHCTQGKDRTGLIVLLILSLLQVDRNLINQDYMLSERELQPEIDERIKEISSIGLKEDFAGCPSDFVDAMVEHINSRYGGVEAYLARISVKRQDREEIVRFLRVDI